MDASKDNALKVFAKGSAVGLAIVAGLIALSDVIQTGSNVDDKIENIAKMQYIPIPEEGKCLYADPHKKQQVEYGGIDNYLTVKLPMSLLFSDTQKRISDSEGIAGTIPVYGTAPCEFLNNNLSSVFNSREEAMDAERESSAAVVARLKELQKEYPKHQQIQYKTLSMP